MDTTELKKMAYCDFLEEILIDKDHANIIDDSTKKMLSDNLQHHCRPLWAKKFDEIGQGQQLTDQQRVDIQKQNVEHFERLWDDWIHFKPILK